MTVATVVAMVICTIVLIGLLVSAAGGDDDA